MRNAWHLLMHKAVVIRWLPSHFMYIFMREHSAPNYQVMFNCKINESCSVFTCYIFVYAHCLNIWNLQCLECVRISLSLLKLKSSQLGRVVEHIKLKNIIYVYIIAFKTSILLVKVYFIFKNVYFYLIYLHFIFLL